MAQLLIGLISLGGCLSSSQLFKICLGVSELLKSNMTTTKNTNQDSDISSIIEEHNLECLIYVVTSITNNGKLGCIDKKIDSGLSESQYILIETQEDFLKSLDTDQIVIYYLCDSLIKINNLLDQVNKKNNDYKNSYVAFRKPNF